MASTLLLALVFVIDVIAFGLAVAAEQRSTASIGSNGRESYCVYDKDIATGLGVGSLLLLVLSHETEWFQNLGNCLVHNLLGVLLDRRGMLAGRVSPECLPHQVQESLERSPDMCDIEEGCIRSRGCIRFPDGHRLGVVLH
ncbi:WD repeat-containing protein 44-like [Hibiscus syriacus]|uniref:WD repeat-containing protein 44-like n=1 Tax=Hibiscus syriacus TaxID=106335 RepID=A0A6A2XU08_HIBSY|nr:WD repeat-containing protein 44-like [Hibiscus syriacus]